MLPSAPWRVDCCYELTGSRRCYVLQVHATCMGVASSDVYRFLVNRQTAGDADIWTCSACTVPPPGRDPMYVINETRKSVFGMLTSDARAASSIWPSPHGERYRSWVWATSTSRATASVCSPACSTDWRSCRWTECRRAWRMSARSCHRRRRRWSTTSTWTTCRAASTWTTMTSFTDSQHVSSPAHGLFTQPRCQVGTGRITTPKAGTVAYNMQSVISTRLSGAWLRRCRRTLPRRRRAFCAMRLALCRRRGSRARRKSTSYVCSVCVRTSSAGTAPWTISCGRLATA